MSSHDPDRHDPEPRDWDPESEPMPSHARPEWTVFLEGGEPDDADR